jgi:beta-galactosidase
MRNIELGSQIFINKHDKPSQVKQWVRQFGASGLKIIRLFVVWDQVEPEKNIWDFTNYDACFEEAETQGLKVVPTLMPVSPPGWMNITSGIQDVADLDDLALWSKSLSYVAKVVERYYKSPVIHSWILWNEPCRSITPNENSLRAFREYLRKVYQDDISSLNRLYYNEYKTFDDVGNVKAVNSNSLAFKGYTETLDWVRFSVFNLCEKLKDIRDEIRKLDTLHPVHVNPHGVGQNLLNIGQSIWNEAKIVDFIGCSAHPSFHSTRFPKERLHQSVACFADLMKSATRHPNGEFWVTELQGGTNIFSGLTYLCPTPDDIRHWLWESIGSGASVILFWCFNTRNGGSEGGEWGLLNQAGLPSGRLNAASEVAKILAENKELFDATKPKEPDVWILYSENSWALGLMEGSSDDVANPRNRQMNADALCGAYLICADLGLDVGFIDEERFIINGLKEDTILILPGTISLATETGEALEKFVRNGGTFIADGLCGMKDVNGYISGENKETVDRIFGNILIDVEAAGSEFDIDLTERNEKLVGWFIKCSFAENPSENVIGRFADGKAGIIKNTYFRGSAIRIGTVFFQRYLTEQYKGHLLFLKAMIPRRESKDVKLENPSFTLRLKALKSDSYDLLIIMNRGGVTEAKLSFPGKGFLSSLDGRFNLEVKEPFMNINIKAQAVELFRFVIS